MNAAVVAGGVVSGGAKVKTSPGKSGWLVTSPGVLVTSSGALVTRCGTFGPGSSDSESSCGADVVSKAKLILIFYIVA